jgi:hypothetical protein
MPNHHDVDPKTFRCRRCGRGLLAIQYEDCVPATAVPRGTVGTKGTVPQRALDGINRGWKPTL